MLIKLFPIFLLVLLVSSVFASDYSDFFDRYPNSGGGGIDNSDTPNKKDMSFTFETSCDNNLLQVFNFDDPITDARISIIGIDSPFVLTNYTDDDGFISFPGQGIKVKIGITKSGYHPISITEVLISQSDCEEPEPEKKPVDEVPIYECARNSDCTDSEYCYIEGRAPGGQCHAVIGCGVSSNHILIPYECGDAMSCPSCPEDKYCSNNSCVSIDIAGPSSAYPGDDGLFYASNGGVPCVNCNIIITKPDGTNFTMKSDDGGFVSVHFYDVGAYMVTLQKGLTTTSAVASAGARNEVQGDVESPKFFLQDYYLYVSIILIVVLLVLVYLWKTKKDEIDGDSDQIDDESHSSDQETHAEEHY